MSDAELEQLQTAIRRQWPRVPSKKAQPYVHAFSATVRQGTKITAKVVGNHGTYTVSIQLNAQGLTSACSCYIGKHGSCHHCEALALTFLADPGAFNIVKVTQRKDVHALTDVQAYLRSVTPGSLTDTAQSPGDLPESLCGADRHEYSAFVRNQIERVAPSLLQ